MSNSSMIAMDAWIAGHYSRSRRPHPPFLPNKANQGFGNGFHDRVEFGTNSSLPRVIRRGGVSGSGILRNEPNSGSGREFKAREIAQHFYGTNPIFDSSTISMAARKAGSVRLSRLCVRNPGRSCRSAANSPRIAHLRVLTDAQIAPCGLQVNFLQNEPNASLVVKVPQNNVDFLGNEANG